MKSARVRPSSFILVTDVILVSIHIKHKLHIRHRALCVCVCVHKRRLYIGFVCIRIEIRIWLFHYK